MSALARSGRRDRGRWCSPAAVAAEHRRCGSAARRARARSKLTLWVGLTARELGVFKKVVDEYDTGAPRHHGQASSAGSTTTRSSPRSAAATRPTSSARSTSDNVGAYCSSGGWIDLAPLHEAGQHQRERLPGRAAVLHAVQGQALRAAAARRRLRPLLQQDAASRRPASRGPPKTISELTADAKKLTVAQPGRLAQGRRLRPVIGFYENAPDALGAAVRRASGIDAKGNVDPGHGPGAGRRC